MTPSALWVILGQVYKILHSFWTQLRPLAPPYIRQRQRVKGKEETKGGQQMDRAEKKSCLG